jgi:hypothetical protein
MRLDISQAEPRLLYMIFQIQTRVFISLLFSIFLRKKQK